MRLLMIAAILAAGCAALALAALGSTGTAPVSADVPTPTPTPTPTTASGYVVTTTNSGPAADAFDFGFTTIGHPASGFVLVSNAPGCASPSLSSDSTQIGTVDISLGFQIFTLPVYRTTEHVIWPSLCVDPGESVSVKFTDVGLVRQYPPGYNPYDPVGVFFDLSVASSTPTYTVTLTPTITPTPSPSPIPVGFSMHIDCDRSTPGVQNTCNVSLDHSTLDVGVVLTNNSGADMRFVGFGFNVTSPDAAKLNPINLGSAGLDANPDFNNAIVGPWSCIPVIANEGGLPGAISVISCFNGSIASTQTLAAGQSIELGVVHYSIPVAATAGSLSLTITHGSLYDDSFIEVATCAPIVTTAFTDCAPATVNLIPPPVGTPTVTPSATGTPLPPTSTPTSQATSSAPAATPTAPFFLAIDCDTLVPGLQDDCTYPVNASRFNVAVVAVNNSADQFKVASLEFRLHDPDTSRLLPPVVPSPDDLDKNPDFNQTALGSSWICDLPHPLPDNGSDGPGKAVSAIGCSASLAGLPFQLAHSSFRLATVAYDVPVGATAGAIALTLADVALFDSTFTEIGSCAPAVTAPAPCLPATIHLVAAPTATPTATTTATPTATPIIPGINKIPEGNAANADLSVPKANLWLCQSPAPCAGPGEGNLRVVEHASNVVTGDQNGDSIPDGLGAYEFSVEYDNFVIQSVNPCDIVFGPGGAGASRGPVDELNSSSSANPDCTPDPNAANNGTCSMSFVLENLVRFGCVTNGQAPGPSGDFDLASFNLIPHPDLTNDIFPGNDNGVLTVLKDNGCELVDVFGHPVTGSVNGGLTPVCGDLAITVRILEGDLNLDCTVDVTDEQLISFRYGAFFGDIFYQKWYDLEPALHDLDIDIKDLQKVFGRDGSTCQSPIPDQFPADPPAPFGD